MPRSILCPRHGDTTSVLACEHVYAAVGSGTEPPVYRRLGVTLDDAGQVAYCACFACANQYELASEVRASPGADTDKRKFPSSAPICTKCLEQTRAPPPAAELAALRSEPASTHAQSSARPIQVTAAVLVLCLSVVIQAVTWALSFIHGTGLGNAFVSGIFLFVDAYLTYGIWMRSARARNIFAGLFVVSLIFDFILGGTPTTLFFVLDLIALLLLFSGPGALWFARDF
jgi:hypothetical protein